MNNDVIIGGGATSSTSSEFQLYPSSPETQQIFQPTSHFPITTMNPQQQNPRKKRTKMMRLQNTTAIVGGGSCSGHHSTKPKQVKKPDPSAPKITPPCSECGKKFWSWKALFGHMRCHPERSWRGINPPVAVHHGGSTSTSTNEERYVASCLLMLANGPTQIDEYEEFGNHLAHPGWFECTSCKKVFGSHQALGGHRASHKNVKGCFAITQKEGGEEVEEGEIEGHFQNNNTTMMIVGTSNGEHKCGICSRVFSSGQALGGHKRCHWEKEDDVVPAASTLILSQGRYGFDLNSPAPREDYSSCSNVGLDLRLGL